MALEWIHEDNPRWDDTKAAIVGGAPDGVFDLAHYREGALLPGEWWRVEDGGDVVGYGWMDCTWGDAEVLLAVSPRRQGAGIGGFVLDRLGAEATARGVNYLYNTVRATHPDRDRVTRWLGARGFVDSGGGLLKRRVPSSR